MNKIFVPKVIFKKDIVSDEKRIESAYARLFMIARNNILAKRQLTKVMTQKYTEVQDGRNIFDNRGGVQEVAC